jgi:dihydrofolate synthase
VKHLHLSAEPALEPYNESTDAQTFECKDIILRRALHFRSELVIIYEIRAPSMTIKLGLERMRSLYGQHSPKWKAIHVAGTNGKGSICSFLTALLTRNGISHGRFTSPIMRRPEDSILINNEPIPTHLFRSFYESAGDTTREDIATHFERMAYAAFKAFDHFGVKYGVVETGLGGRLDATNVLQNKVVTVIAKIGLDHQEYLGNTIEEISAEKGAIMRKGVPSVINQRNPREALDVLLRMAKDIGAHPVLVAPGSNDVLSEAVVRRGEAQGWPDHTVDNALCAAHAFSQLDGIGIQDAISSLDALPQSPLEGRLQHLDISGTALGKQFERTRALILDGAHNLDACRALEAHVSKNVRRSESDPVVWVIAMSRPRQDQAAEMLSFIRPNDSVIFTQYQHLDRRQDHPKYEDLALAFRPPPLSSNEFGALCSGPGQGPPVSRMLCPSASDAIREAVQVASRRKGEMSGDGEVPIIITGSLYLVGDILRLKDEMFA